MFEKMFKERFEKIEGFKELFTECYRKGRIVIYKYELSEPGDPRYYLLHGGTLVKLKGEKEYEEAKEGNLPLNMSKKLTRNTKDVEKMIILAGGIDGIKKGKEEIRKEREMMGKIQ